MTMNYLMEITDFTAPIEAMADKLSFGGMIMLIGMVAVFSVLGIIFAVLKIFSLVFGSSSSKEQKPKQAPAPIQAPIQPKITNDGEIAAVIAAAIAMAESESNGMKFKVVSFRRVK